MFLFVSSVFLGYFLARYFVNTAGITQNHEDIKNLKMIAENLNLMKKVKLYAIESVIDNSKFKNYTLLSNLTLQYVDDLYEHQRRYNTYIYPASANLAVIFGNEQISTLIKESLCTQENIDLYLSATFVVNIYPKNSYSTK